jgi:uncharacterized membrane protein
MMIAAVTASCQTAVARVVGESRIVKADLIIGEAVLRRISMPLQNAVDVDTPAGPNSVDELTGRNLRMILEQERVARSAHSLGERLAGHIAAFCGSMPFIWIHVAFFAAWIVFHTSPWAGLMRDPFPFFFLSFLVSLEAIFLSAFILISQNQEKRLTEQRSHLDLQINLLTEQENTHMLKMLRSIAVKVGADFDDHPDMAAMEQTTQPERLLQQIDEATQLQKKPLDS